MADGRRRHGVDWQGRGQDPERGTRRDVTERGRDTGRTREFRDEDRGPGRGYREEDRDRDRFGGGGVGPGGRGIRARDSGRYGRGYEYGGDEDLGRFDQDSREEYQRGGLMRGAPGRRRAGGPGEEFGEGFWSEVTRERTRGDFNRYGDRGVVRTQPYDTERWDRGTYGLGTGDPGDDRGYNTRGWASEDVAALPLRERPQYMERPGVGYSTSPTRNMDRDTGHGAGRGGMQGAYPRQGRGPRNYQRADERIREDICDRLMQGWMDADAVDVRVDGGEVTLSGTVGSRNEKRAIEDLAEEVLGVKEVHNEIRVAREPQREEDRGAQQQDRTLQ
ncbi:BON domain-containing protein [Vitiosangium sp. GDMCC 1.1324]|uniref:BON domain-containing protein n=1 Tax=Vitiosangium sp. (strain GDMCC 1.1324) TaxID=2138576 RepID=UPI000D377479|nr:BON domain-containing protein [Vitiosangium sp. GDMCC 1.1324]PTL79308.1 hypothetical protein DAT35_34470 [Vitiosangium sp. GDMCC 1.1324]